jgi:hypothetical protein
MIVNIRATSGAGKSHIVRTIMKDYDSIIKVAYPADANKRKPLGYLCARDSMTRHLFIPGHYEIANGGIDTIGEKFPYIYDLIHGHHGLGSDVLYEGKYFTDKLDAILAWHKAGLDIRVVFINHPIKDCLASVEKRGHNIQQQTISKLYHKSLREAECLAKTDIKHVVATRNDAVLHIREWLMGGTCT